MRGKLEACGSPNTKLYMERVSKIARTLVAKCICAIPFEMGPSNSGILKDLYSAEDGEEEIGKHKH